MVGLILTKQFEDQVAVVSGHDPVKAKSCQGSLMPVGRIKLISPNLLPLEIQ